MLLKLDQAFYVKWLSEKTATPLQNALHYMIGIHPESRGTTLPDIKIKVESLEARLRFLKDFAAGNEKEAIRFSNIVKDATVLSSQDFTFLMYQYISDFPEALYKVYEQVTKKSLALEEDSPIRRVYEDYAKLDLWTLRQACSLVIHMHPECESFNIDEGKLMGSPELIQRMKLLPHSSTYLFPNLELYENNHKLVMASISAGKLKCIEQDFQNVKKKSVIPIEFLAWAKTKGIKFHAILEELVGCYALPNGSSDTVKQNTSTPRLSAIYKEKVQVAAKILWEQNPTMTIEAIKKHRYIQEFAGGKQYSGKNTLRDWISEVDPRLKAEKTGRPFSKIPG
ncbi:MAG: hypothetical protein K2W94_00565 [Alphaproteobacteria bacterium]|nr:hypothetical protein [Alphaproteobacteria bacterium]